MEKAEMEAKIKRALPDAAIEVEGADCNFSVVVLSERFEKMPPVRRQQQVLACFSDQLSSGALHALSVKAHTPAEWARLEQKPPARIP
ncbi:MAG: BolA/IbaG family iron-sulfur metabolism protein [Gammaproteobacteria bacterium]